MEKTKKYYWLKLQDNFFERDEIKVIESMPEGKEYILLYFKLLLKSVGTEGELLFRGAIPYTPEMLGSITNTPVATVRYAIDIFIQLGLMETLSSGALWMSELSKMVGSETDFAKKKREYRENLKKTEDKSKINLKQEKENLLENKQEDIIETKKDNVRQELELETELEKEQQQTEKKIVVESNLEKKWEEYTKEEQEKAIKLVGANAKNKIAVALTILRKGLKKEKYINTKKFENGIYIKKGLTAEDYLNSLATKDETKETPNTKIPSNFSEFINKKTVGLAEEKSREEILEQMKKFENRR
ncbi:MAG: phage replisome organizer N-terminal domain-containing protein [Fusobacteriaceae bacterium]